MWPTLEILTVVKIIANRFKKLPVMVLPFVNKHVRFPMYKNFVLYYPIRYYLFFQSRCHVFKLMLIVLIYWSPVRIRRFIADLIEALHSFLFHHWTVWTVVLGNFNIDQRSQDNVSLFISFIIIGFFLLNDQDSQHKYMGEY